MSYNQNQNQNNVGGIPTIDVSMKSFGQARRNFNHQSINDTEQKPRLRAIHMVNNKIFVDVLLSLGFKIAIDMTGKTDSAKFRLFDISEVPGVENQFPMSIDSESERVVRSQIRKVASIYYAEDLTNDTIDEIYNDVRKIIALSTLAYSVINSTYRSMNEAQLQTTDGCYLGFLMNGYNPFLTLKSIDGFTSKAGPWDKVGATVDPRYYADNRVMFGYGKASNSEWKRLLGSLNAIFLNDQVREMCELLYSNHIILNSEDGALNVATVFPLVYDEYSITPVDSDYAFVENLLSWCIQEIKNTYSHTPYIADILETLGYKQGIYKDFTRDLAQQTFSFIKDNDNSELRRVMQSAITNADFNLSVRDLLEDTEINVNCGDGYFYYPSDLSYELGIANVVNGILTYPPTITVPISGDIALYLQMSVVKYIPSVLWFQSDQGVEDISNNEFMIADYAIAPNTSLVLKPDNDFKTAAVAAKVVEVLSQYALATCPLIASDCLYPSYSKVYMINVGYDQGRAYGTFDVVNAECMLTPDIDDYYATNSDIILIGTQNMSHLFVPYAYKKLGPVNTVVPTTYNVSNQSYKKRDNNDKHKSPNKKNK